MGYENEIRRKRTLDGLDRLGLRLASRGHVWSNEERLAYEQQVKALRLKTKHPK